MSLVATLTLPLIEKWQADTLDKNERRFSDCGVLEQFQMQTKKPGSILSAKVIENIKQSAGTLVKIPVINQQTVTIGNVRSCTVSASEQTSALVTLNFFTMVSSFQIYPDQFAVNYVGYEADYQTKLTNMIIAWQKYLDTYGRNILENNRNQYYPANILAYYPVAGNALQIPASDENDAFNKMSAILTEMDFMAQPNVLASTTTQPLINRIKNQSSQNAINQAFQLNPFRWGWSNRITNGSNVGKTFYMVPDGNIAIENRNLPANIAKRDIGGDVVQWGEVLLPYLDMTVGTLYKKECVDASAIVGQAQLTQTMVESFEFSTDVCFVTSYNSDPATRYNPIIKGEILAP